MYKINYYLSFLSIFFFVSSAFAGVEVGGTRVIYDGNKKEAILSIKNAENNTPYLIQSWLDNGNENETTKIPFIITPPLFRLDPNQENQLRIINVGTVPQDRESIFWISVKSIAASSNQPNRLQISVRTRIKLIYRPESIKSSAGSAYKKLIAVRRGNVVTFTNPTPYYVSFYSVHVGNKALDQPLMVSPSGTYSLNVPPGASGKISWRAINDYGGQTEEVSR